MVKNLAPEQALTLTSLDCRDPDVIGAYLSRKIPDAYRAQITRCLANDSVARELMHMSYLALETVRQPVRSDQRNVQR